MARFDAKVVPFCYVVIADDAKKKLIACVRMPVAQGPSADLKKAASILLKGGTLTNDQCPKCQGVVVRYLGKDTCVACGYEGSPLGDNGGHETVEAQTGIESAPRTSSDALVSLVTDKLLMVAGELKGDSDIGSQQRKADLVETYLRILQLLKGHGATG